MIKIPTKKSKKVLDFETIAKEAAAMTRLLQTYRTPNGKGPENHYALHHSQYSSHPYNFFVINNWVVEAPINQTVVIVNPEIIEKDPNSKMTFSEGCMSFPFRPGKKVLRYNRIKVRYQVPTPDGKKLLTEEKEFTGVLAQIFQHEIQHGNGGHIYK